MEYSGPSLEQHMRFICPECGEEYKTQQEWRNHLNEFHQYLKKTHTDFDFKEINDHYHECLICHKWVANARNAIALLQYHRFLHLPYSHTYRCRHCTGSFARKRALCEHLQRFHGRLIARIEKQRLNKTRNELTALKDPIQNTEFYMRFICPQCGIQIDRFKQWLEHLETGHTCTSKELNVKRIMGTANYHCLHCNKVIFSSSKSKLQRHVFTHLSHKSYFKCAYCGVRKSYKMELLRHFLAEHARIAQQRHIVRPLEWGGPAAERVLNDVNMLLSDRSKKTEPNSQSKKTDLMQQALRKSQVNLMDETQQSKGPTVETDLDELCITFFESIAKADMKRKIEQTANLPQDEDGEVISIEIDTLDGRKQTVLTPCNTLKRPKLHLTDLTNEALEQYIRYLCPVCGLQYDLHTHWRQHVFNAHNLSKAIKNQFKMLDNNNYLCLECMDMLHVNKHADLQRHHFMHMPYQSYLKCNICKTMKSSKTKMLLHLREEHAQSKQQSKESNVEQSTQTNSSKIVAENNRLLAHLRQARVRIAKLLEEIRSESNN